MGAEIARLGKASGQDQILGERRQKSEQEGREKPARFSEVIILEIDSPAGKRLGDDQRGHHKDGRRLEQHNQEGCEAPMLDRAQREHGPPGLNLDQEGRCHPQWRRPPQFDLAARSNERCNAAEKMRDAKAEDQRDEDRQIGEAIHSG